MDISEELIDKIRTIFNIELPLSILKQMVIVFQDQNKDNWDINNIEYYFKNGPTKCPFYNDYYYIPGFSRYAINKSGDLIVIKTGKHKKWSISKSNGTITGGYFVTHAISDFGVRKGISRHRLLGLTFKHPRCCTKQLLINHKDGIPGNDDLLNIEFCTSSENIKHAYQNNLFKTRLTPVDTHNWKTNEYISFPSITECALYFKKSEGYVRGKIRSGSNKKHQDGVRIKFKNQCWLPLDQFINERDTNTDVICRNIFTNEIFVFGSIADASRHTGVKQGSIKTHIDISPYGPLFGWNFRKLDVFEDWPIYTDKHLRIFKENNGCSIFGIEVFDINNNTELFFESSNKAGEYFNISPITASKLARYNQLYKKRYQFKLFRTDNN